MWRPSYERNLMVSEDRPESKGASTQEEKDKPLGREAYLYLIYGCRGQGLEGDIVVGDAGIAEVRGTGGLALVVRRGVGLGVGAGVRLAIGV